MKYKCQMQFQGSPGTLFQSTAYLHLLHISKCSIAYIDLRQRRVQMRKGEEGGYVNDDYQKYTIF